MRVTSTAELVRSETMCACEGCDHVAQVVEGNAAFCFSCYLKRDAEKEAAERRARRAAFALLKS
jgi:hypothetical protein